MNYGLQALKLVFGLLSLLLALRMLGKRNLSQLTPYDAVYIIVFGGILDATFYNDEVGVFPFLFSIAVWTVSIYIIEILVRRFEFLRITFKGTPDHIVDNGKLNLRLFEKNNLEMEQLRMALRKNGIFSLKEVRDIYLEPDGSFSVNRFSDYQTVTNSGLNIQKEDDTTVLLIEEGKIETKALIYIGKSKDWLREELKKLGIDDISTVIYCEWSQLDGFYYKTEKDAIRLKKGGHAN
ncbi:MAG: DUF421 domain-containing protein [Clostridiales bacterium]|nr:DUF421 domain-containing protein [Clostridiales bacterium]